MKSHEQAASERRREYERVRSIALCSHVFSPLASLVKACSQGKSNVTISTHSHFLRFVCLFVCKAFSAVIVRQIWPRKKRILEHYNNLYKKNNVSLQSTIIIQMSEKETYPLKGGKMIHIHTRGEKKAFVSTS